MSGKNALKLNKDIIKFAVLFIIISVIAGIWILKNNQADETEIENINPDFTLNVSEEIDLERLKSYGLPILIDFGADSCIPCKEMAPILKKLNAELRGKAIIKFVDVWKNQGLASGYPVSVIPTQFLFDSKGDPYSPKDDKPIRFHKYSSKDTNKHIFTSHEGGMTETMIRTVLVEMGLKE
jgi:thioredoxin 1